MANNYMYYFRPFKLICQQPGYFTELLQVGLGQIPKLDQF